MKSYWVYILQCSDSTYYTGVTNNIDRRVAEHKAGDDPRSYTFRRRPLKLVWCLECHQIEEAIDLEKKLKRWSKKKKEALIRGDFDVLPSFSKKKFEQ